MFADTIFGTLPYFSKFFSHSPRALCTLEKYHIEYSISLHKIILQYENESIVLLCNPGIERPSNSKYIMDLSNLKICFICLGTPGFVVIGGKRREEPRSPVMFHL